jgi:very-short-patch-repair endonuclease
MKKMPKKTNDEFLREVYQQVKGDYTFLENYKTTHHPILVRHNICNSEYKVSPANFLRGKRCPVCYKRNRYKSKEEFRRQFYLLAGNDYSLLSDYIHSNGRIKVKHNLCGREYWVRATGFINDKKRCPYCSGKRKKTHEQFVEIVKQISNGEYSVLDAYVNEKTPIRFQHNTCGEIFKLKPYTFLYNKRKCPICPNHKTKSTGEYRIENFLKRNYIPFESQKRFDDCFYKGKLSFDFYLPNNNVCIEFDGVQHYRLCFNKKIEEFKNQQKRDEIKNQYCKQEGINLLRIPYWELEKIEDIIADFLNLHKNNCQQGGVKWRRRHSNGLIITGR